MNVLITGAAGGLGRAMAVECADRGFNVFLTDINEAGLNAVSKGIAMQYGAKVASACCDLTDEAAVDKMLDAFASQNISFDMLLNVAGVDFEGGFMERDPKKILRIIKLNIEATLIITHKVLKRRNPDSRFYLVFVSSLASMYPMPLKATYAASKRFLLDFSTALRQELRSKNVSVLTVCPGGLATTQNALCGIAAQGFWGNATTNRLELVAGNTITKALKNRKLYIPGAVNKIFSFVGRFVSHELIAALLYNRWRKAQARWLKLT